MSRNDIIKFLILKTIGNFFVLFALYGVGVTFGPALYFEINYRINIARGVTYKVPDFPKIATTQKDSKDIVVEHGFDSILKDANISILIPKSTLFSILIPKIGANAQVFANVDPGNEKEYNEALRKGVAHARGTVFPGMQGVVYLFAHSTDNFWDAGRYNAVFYLLKNVSVGDDVIIFFQNKRHNYRVVETRIIEGNDVSYLLNAQSIRKEQVVLQTCWPPGTTWKRLVVIAEPIR